MNELCGNTSDSAIYVGIVLNDHDFSETIQFGMIDCMHLRSDWNNYCTLPSIKLDLHLHLLGECE